jgi:thiol-disulfide isomerase/thioredoxin
LRSTISAAALLTMLLLTAGCGPRVPEAGEAEAAASGTVMAPDMDLVSLDGTVTRLSDLRGKVVVLNFWATWCPPCRVELPHFSDLYDAYRDRDVAVVGVSFDYGSDVGMVKEFVRNASLSYPIAKVRNLAELEEIERLWSAVKGIPTVTGFGDGEAEPANGSVQMMPTTFMLDREGRIYRKHVGPRERRHLEPELKALLGLGT